MGANFIRKIFRSDIADVNEAELLAVIEDAGEKCRLIVTVIFLWIRGMKRSTERFADTRRSSRPWESGWHIVWNVNRFDIAGNEKGDMVKSMKEFKTDIVLKDFWRDNHRFASLFNAVVFDGKEVIHPENLQV